MEQILGNPMSQTIAGVLALGAAAYLLSRVYAPIGRWLALAAGVWVLVAGVGVAQEAPKAYPPVMSLPLGPVILNVSFASALLGNLVVLAAAAFTILIALYSFRAMAGAYWEGKFYAYLIWAFAGACLVGWAGDFFVLLVGWELTTLMLFLMLNQGRPGSETGAAKTYAILGFADACLLLAVALMLAPGMGDQLQPGEPMYNLSLPVEGQALPVGNFGWMGYAIYALLLVAALAKAGAIPLHTWIPSAAAAAPTPVFAFLPAAVDKLLGIYLLARVALDVFRPDGTFQAILMIAGGVTIIAAVFMAMMQHNLKRLLAFHAVSQVGYMILGIGTGTAVGVIGGLFHMLNNAIYKSNLFLMSGVVGRTAGSDEIEDMGGLARRIPITFICGVISAMAISGVPPFNGFVSKWLIYQGTLELRSGLGLAMLVVAVFGSALTLASFVKVLYAAFLSRRPPGQREQAGGGESVFSAVPMIVLATGCVVLGLWPDLITGKVLAPAVSGAIPDAPGAIASTGGMLSVEGGGAWAPAVALVLILIGLAGGLVLLGIFAFKNIRVVRPFISGEIIEDDRVRVPGTGFYETIKRSPGLGPLLEHGERGAMDLYAWCGRYGGGVVQWLRNQHTGLISLYVAWCMIGLAATLVYLLIAGRVAS